jgi:hypothetical protein
VQQVVEHASPAPVIQPKLILGPSDDRYEREADRIAHQVTRGVTPPMKSEAGPERVMRAPAIQAMHGAAGGAVDTGIQQAIEGARGGGQPLPEGVRASMERALGADFDGVRVHTGAHADQLNRALQARAFTTGQDIFFRRSEYSPTSFGGRQVLAHELTHVMQQTRAQQNNVDKVGAIQRMRIQGYDTEVRKELIKLKNIIWDMRSVDEVDRMLSEINQNGGAKTGNEKTVVKELDD